MQTFEVYFSCSVKSRRASAARQRCSSKLLCVGPLAEVGAEFFPPLRIILIITYMDSERAGKWIC